MTEQQAERPRSCPPGYAPGTRCHLPTGEGDPLARPFVHSPGVSFATALLVNAAIRLLPAGKTKTFALRLAVGAESVNDARNIWVSLAVSK